MSLTSERKSLQTGRPTWAEIHLEALAANFHLVKERVGPDVKVMAVVKANAYGHGAVACARRLEREGADWFGVALPEEGIELRNSGIALPILCLAGFWGEQAAACLQHKLVPVVYRLDLIEAFDRAARERGVVAAVHVKIDTGMGRLGVRFDEIADFVGALKQFKNIRVDGFMTHFAAADEPSCGPLTRDQIERFETAVAAFREHGFEPSYRHLANSAAVFGQPSAWGNLVRPGGVLYGLWRDILAPEDRDVKLQPVMSLHARITLLKWVPQGETVGYGCTFEASRKTLVATVPIGYDDGYMRALSNRGHAIIRGVYVTVIGRISMDLTLIDVTNVPGVQTDDEVTFMGTEGGLSISAEEIAKTVGTLSYEVTCGISERVPRLYVSNE
ncbi:MAG TPA: alanine racemase [Pyrinomonadaceae bacterium]|jgi:alanine racemase|nr:alanine racemase [Pyrinomonadaceae bacterium]